MTGLAGTILDSKKFSGMELGSTSATLRRACTEWMQIWPSEADDDDSDDNDVDDDVDDDVVMMKLVDAGGDNMAMDQ